MDNRGVPTLQMKKIRLLFKSWTSKNWIIHLWEVTVGWNAQNYFQGDQQKGKGHKQISNAK